MERIRTTNGGRIVHGCEVTASAHARAGRAIRDDVTDLARQALDRQLNDAPGMRAYFSGDRYKRSVDDTVYHLTALAQALIVEEPTLLLEYVAWAKIVLVSRGLHDEHLAGSLVAIRETLVAVLDGTMSDAATGYVDASLVALTGASGELPPATGSDAPLAGVARGYLEALLEGDRETAAGIVDDAMTAGAAPPDIYEGVFRVAQHEIGRMWQSNRISVAIEHFATGAAEAIMLKHCAAEWSKTAGAPRFLGGCVEGEQHDLGVRFVCDVLQSHGWEAYFLGASTPEAALLEAVGRLRPAVVGLSTSSYFHIDTTRQAIASLHATYPDVKIVVGGGPFDRIDGLAEKVGADAHGGDLLDVAARFDLLIARDHGPATAAPGSVSR